VKKAEKPGCFLIFQVELKLLCAVFNYNFMESKKLEK